MCLCNPRTGGEVSEKKLDENAVRVIRRAVKARSALSNKNIARRFGVSVQTIRNVIKGTRWSWVK
jgi:transposase